MLRASQETHCVTGELWFSSLNSGSELRSATSLPHKVPLLKGNGVKWKGSHLGSCQRSAADRRWPGNGFTSVAEPPGQTAISQSSWGSKKNGVKWPKTLKRQWHQKWSLTQDTKENQEDKSLSFKPCTCFRHTVFATFPLNEEINHPAPDIFNNFKNVVRAILNFIDILYGSSISSNVNETSMSIN